MTWKPDNSHRDAKWLQELQEELQNPVLKQLEKDEFKKAIIAENTRYMQAAEIPDQNEPQLTNFDSVGTITE